eukprot:TRINITY_DN38710_c0_g1_i1.p4 TRINITY_DN38710_c0_g1~~TRINITY_DN38710_c0_g1_i1.p4  ORF type:complete len:108 (+),score=1.27 TRINITY_DN38710_c0_g1_i1:785-1108(+)
MIVVSIICKDIVLLLQCSLRKLMVQMTTFGVPSLKAHSQPTPRCRTAAITDGKSPYHAMFFLHPWGGESRSSFLLPSDDFQDNRVHTAARPLLGGVCSFPIFNLTVS